MKTFLFDLFGTVVDWRGGVAREAAPFLKRYGATGAQPEAFADAWRSRYVPAMREIIGGERSFVRLDVLHRENLLDATSQRQESAACAPRLSRVRMSAVRIRQSI